MTYKIAILRRAEKQLANLSSYDYKKVKQAILDLAHDPHQDVKNSKAGPDGVFAREISA
jgi:mRNA-degrading endonuclease RelE of RelBE toxin-antitoxin system